MQWNAKENAGFTEGTPWIDVNPNYTVINAEAEQKDKDSVFHFYKKLIQLRKQERVLIDGKYDVLLPEHPEIFAYTRTDEHSRLLVICNFTGHEVRYDLPENWEKGELLLRNEAGTFTQGVLGPYEADMVIKRKEDIS